MMIELSCAVDDVVVAGRFWMPRYAWVEECPENWGGVGKSLFENCLENLLGVGGSLLEECLEDSPTTGSSRFGDCLENLRGVGGSWL